MKNTELAISYIRYSTPEQGRGGSYQRQYQRTELYCKQRGYTLLAENAYFDDGVSAFSGANKANGKLGQLLADVESGKIPRGSRLIVESLDRLGREDVYSQLEFFMKLLNSGLKIVTLGAIVEEYDRETTSDPLKLIVAIMVMIRANEESKTKSDRGQKSWEQKRKNIDSKPLTKMVPEWLEVNGSKISPIPERVAVVKEIFALATQGMGRRAIAKRLNLRKEPVWSSKQRNKLGIWYDSYISKILYNRAVLGEFQPHKKIDRIRKPLGDVVADYYPQVISEEEFYAAKFKITNRWHKGGRAVSTGKNLFAGILNCLRCGSKMQFNDKGHSWRYLNCFEKSMGSKQCKCDPIKYERVERLILLELIGIDWKRVIEPESREGIGSLSKSALRGSLEGKVSELDKKIETLVSLLENGGDGLQRVADRVKALESELKSARRELADFKASEQQARQRTKATLEASQAVEEFLGVTLEPDARLRLKDAVGSLLTSGYVKASKSGQLVIALRLMGSGLILIKASGNGTKNTLHLDTDEREALAPMLRHYMNQSELERFLPGKSMGANEKEAA